LKFGSVYFTTNILAATDQLELQSNIWSRDMTQFDTKVCLSCNRHAACSIVVMLHVWYAFAFRFGSYLF